MEPQNAVLPFPPTSAPFIASENSLRTPDSDAVASSYDTLPSEMLSRDSLPSRKGHTTHETFIPTGQFDSPPINGYVDAMDNQPNNTSAPPPIAADLLPTKIQFPPPPPPPLTPPPMDFGDLDFDDPPEDIPGLPSVRGLFVPFRTLRRFQRGMEVRQDAVKQRNRMELRRRNYNNELKHNTDARDELLALGDGIMEEIKKCQDLSPENGVQLQQAWALFKELNLKITQRSRAIQRLGKAMATSDMELITLDNRLYAKEEAFLKAAVGHTDHHDESDEDDVADGVDEKSERTPVSAASSSENIDPLEADYYDAIGDTSLAREHLFNLETEHKSDLYRRQSRRDLGILPSVPEDEFWREYHKERKKLLDAFKSGKERVERLYRQCLEQNVQVDLPNLPPLVLERPNQTEMILMDGAGDSRSLFNNRRLANQASLMFEQSNYKWTTQLTRAKVLSWKHRVRAESQLEHLPASQGPPPSPEISDDEGEDDYGMGEVDGNGSMRNHRSSMTGSLSRRSSCSSSFSPKTFRGERMERRYSDPYARDRKFFLQDSLQQHTRHRALSTSLVL